VEHFHARKFRDKNAPSTEKLAIHKVVGAGSGKRQKTPVKSSVKDVFQVLLEAKHSVDPDIEMNDDNKEVQETDQAMETDPLSADPNNLMGAHGEPHQEK
jgi:hypothetical protein